MSTKDKLIKIIGEPCVNNDDKVTVVGTGDVGMATVFAILTQGVSSDLAMYDVNENKMMGEQLDLLHGSYFLNAKVSAAKGGDWSVTAGSKVCIITAGVRQKEGESRLELVKRNTEILKSIIPNLIQHSPDTVLIMVSNPVDILSWVAWKISGLPKHRIIGSGTALDSSRLRYLVAEKLGVSPISIHGMILGEHGDSSVPIWSNLNVAGVRLRDLNPNLGTDEDSENWKELHTKVVNAASDVIALKGFTNWAIGLGAAHITNAILKNSNRVIPISTHIKGYCGIEHDVFLSIPASLGRNGVVAVVEPNLAEDERCAMKFAAAKLAEIAKGVEI